MGVTLGRNEKANPMSEEFHDWLEQCPVSWYRNKPSSDDTHVEYGFEIDTN